jgi:NAD(P)-dependent dehydrogenase (short-subunit alcohol dehydrogenase family)
VGLATACELARTGWRVIALGRNPARSRAALEKISQAAPGAKVDMVLADLAVLAEARRAAAEIAKLTDRIDLLVNNTGFMPAKRVVTGEGLEETFAGNHLGPFLLTRELMPLLVGGGPNAQVINTSSIAHKSVKDMQWDDLQLARKFGAGQAYSQSKLANILFTRALASRLAGIDIRVNAVHPGMVASNFSSHGNLVIKILYYLGKPISVSPAKGADTILWLASGGDGGTGGYYVKRKRVPLTPAAQSDEGAERLWQISEALIATHLNS